MIFVGIDPGKFGAVALLTDEGKIIDLEPMGEDVFWFVDFMNEYIRREERPIMVFCEKAQHVMGNGAAGMFTYGKHFGELLGVIAALRLAHELVPPQTWTKIMHAGIAEGAMKHPKDRSRLAAKRLFPDANLKNPNAPRSMKDHDGIVDALLIAEYGRRKMVRK